MADNVEIQGLEFQIVNDSTRAVAGLQNLINTLGRLKTATNGGATGLSKTAQGIRELSNSLKGLNSGDASQKITRLANALTTLSQVGNVKISSSIANQLTAINTALAGLKWTDGDKLTALANGLRPLSELGKANMTTFTHQLSKLPKVIEDLEAADIDKFTRQMNDLAAAMAPFANEMQKVSNGFSTFPSKIQKVVTSSQQYNSAMSGATAKTNAFDTAIKGLKFASLSVIFSKLSQFLATTTNSASEYLEDMNLFTVSMGKYAKEAYEYAQRVSEVMGIDPAEWMRNQGVFNTIISGFGVASDKAALMSKNLTQLGYDIASFYNISFEDSMQKVQSGIAGELEPLRRLGYDLSVARLQQEAYNLGINESVSAMTQAEKSQLRYYAMMTQVTQVQGDMARTLEQPTNMLRVLKAQLDQVVRAIGNLFIPILTKVLPIAIAVAQALREIIAAIADLFGVKLQTVEWDNAFETATVGSGEIADNMGSAASAAKKLKEYTLGFDELNVLSPDTGTGGGGGAGSGGVGGGDLGIDLPEYDFLKGAVTEQIEKWRKKLEPLVTWVKDHLDDILSTVVAIGFAFMSWKIANGILSFFNTFGTFLKSNPLASIGTTLAGVGLFLDAWGTVKDAVLDIIENGANFTNVTQLLSGFAEALGAAFLLMGKIPAAGAMLMLSGVAGILSTISDIANNGINWDNALNLSKYLGLFLSGLGFLTKNTQLGGIGLMISGVTLIVKNLGDLIEAFKTGNWDDVNKIELAAGLLMSAGGLLFAIGKIKDITDKIGGVKGIINTSDTLQKATSSIGGSKGLSIPSPKSVLKGLADLAIIIGGATAIIETIGLLMQIPGFEETAKKGVKAVGLVFSGLWDIILPLITISAGIVALSKIGIATVAKGFAGFAVIIGGSTVLLTAIGALMSIPYFTDFLSTGVASVVSAFNGLWKVAVPIGALSALLIALGIASPALILSGLAGFALVIGGVELILVALGALNQIPGFSWIVGEGGKVLIQLGKILGGFAGSIVNGFLVEVSDSFPEIGKNLAGFMTEAQPFFTGLDSINAESVGAAKKLAEMVLILTAADILEGLTSWITGGSSMIDFGKDLCAFAPYFTRYAKSIKGVDGNAVQASATAAKSLAEFANNIPNSGGVAGFFAGENDIDTWGAKLPAFGRNFKRYSDSVKGVDGNAVQASATAAESIAKFANNIPNEGGVVSWFTGDNSIDVWGAKLPEFGKNFKKYSDSVSGVKSDVVTATSAAVQSIVEFANNIPNSGGVVSWFTGDNGVSSFGKELVTFGQDFENYYNYISGINISKVSSVSSEMDKILDWAIRVSNVDNRNIESFGTTIKKVCDDFAECGENLIDGFVEGIRSKASAFSNSARDLVSGFKRTLTTSANSSKSIILRWASNLKNWFTSSSVGGINRVTFQNFARNVVFGFNQTISHYSGSSKSSMREFAKAAKSAFTDIVSRSVFREIAKDVITGFNLGINDFYYLTRPYMRDWADDAKKTFKKKLDSHSPSKVYKQIGKDTVLGYNLGIADIGGTTQKVVQEWADSFTDIQPTMRFAVDTSALKYYDSDSFAKSISTDSSQNAAVAVGGTERDTDRLEQIYENILSAISTLNNQEKEALNVEVYLDGKQITAAVEKRQRERGATIMGGGYNYAY